MACALLSSFCNKNIEAQLENLLFLRSNQMTGLKSPKSESHLRSSARNPIDDLLAAIATKDPVSGSTHNFYRYPARFSPLFVREVIRQYSSPGQTVMDPFMGGGTTIVEALSLGRKAIGLDINALAHFVTTVKTTPLSENDFAVLAGWLDRLRISTGRGRLLTEPVRNLPPAIQNVFNILKLRIDELPLERQRRFARCAQRVVRDPKIDQSPVDARDVQSRVGETPPSSPAGSRMAATRHCRRA